MPNNSCHFPNRIFDGFYPFICGYKSLISDIKQRTTKGIFIWMIKELFTLSKEELRNQVFIDSVVPWRK
jgi:hypothetical protein|tara:strand:- start:215 stop:421 length:207 start_codon:yes stop_codon:yes gene_type:complete